mmetsp:Transcript_23739/g.39216  ORF Transcript_23739/g.39216 Transcript_23739/m.39216 type:complete len:334 (-) Transcript_23739:519-1520(-)
MCTTKPPSTAVPDQNEDCRESTAFQRPLQFFGVWSIIRDFLRPKTAPRLPSRTTHATTTTGSDGTSATKKFAMSHNSSKDRQTAPLRKPYAAQSLPTQEVKVICERKQQRTTTAINLGERFHTFEKNREINLTTSPPEHTRKMSYQNISHRTRHAVRSAVSASTFAAPRRAAPSASIVTIVPLLTSTYSAEPVCAGILSTVTPAAAQELPVAQEPTAWSRPTQLPTARGLSPPMPTAAAPSVAFALSPIAVQVVQVAAIFLESAEATCTASDCEVRVLSWSSDAINNAPKPPKPTPTSIMGRSDARAQSFDVENVKQPSCSSGDASMLAWHTI